MTCINCDLYNNSFFSVVYFAIIFFIHLIIFSEVCELIFCLNYNDFSYNIITKKIS